MTPGRLAALHKRCFTVPRPFTTAEFSQFLATPGCFLIAEKHGFALGRVAADEAELLTIAVDPGHRRAGIGRALLAAFEEDAGSRGAGQLFLEVAAGNSAAIGLYHATGYAESGRRRGYFRHQDGHREDALVLIKTLHSA